MVCYQLLSVAQKRTCIISEQVCLTEYQILKAKTLILCFFLAWESEQTAVYSNEEVIEGSGSHALDPWDVATPRYAL